MLVIITHAHIIRGFGGTKVHSRKWRFAESYSGYSLRYYTCCFTLTWEWQLQISYQPCGVCWYRVEARKVFNLTRSKL